MLLRTWESMARAKMLVGYLQILAAISMYPLEWPSLFRTLGGIFGFLNLDLLRASSLRCLSSSSLTWYSEVCLLLL